MRSEQAYPEQFFRTAAPDLDDIDNLSRIFGVGDDFDDFVRTIGARPLPAQQRDQLVPHQPPARTERKP